MKNVLLFGLIALVVGAGMATPASAQRSDRPSSALDYLDSSDKTFVDTPGDGYLVGGDLWNTLKPANSSVADRLGNVFTNVGGGMNNRLLFGSRGNWQEPSGNWPSGYPWTNTFRNSHFMVFPVFKSTGWPGYGAGNPVRAVDQSADNAGTGGTSRFMFATFGPNVPGANDPARNYKRPARYVDQARTHMIYETGWPTSSGIDFKVRAHQFTPNTQNLNDFTVLEISMTNTGIVDSNGDGTPEATNNVVDGIGMMLDATVSPAIQLSLAGDRGCNCIAAGRTFGYIAAPDETGSPYNLWAWFANVPPTQTTGRTVPPAGQRSFGIDNRNQLLGYSDIWNAWNFMGVKQGAIQDGNVGAITAGSPDKTTAFGTHPIGTGPQRGWYTSVQWQSGLSSLNASDRAFRNATATWYADYGKISNGGSVPANLAPNPAFFSGGTADDITTWTVGNAAARPNGDFKYAHQDVGVANIEQVQPVWEPAWNPGAASGDFYNGMQGFAREYTFGQSLTQGVGPFSLAVGESITVVWVAAAGFRMEGVTDAVESARWAWGQGWNIDNALPTPAAPEMNIESTTTGTALIRWTDVASIRPIDGYKVWRSAQYKRTSYQDVGMRLQDRYQEQHAPGTVPANLLDARNPNFDAFSVFTGDIQGSYQPAEWGTYELIAKIPVGQLAQYANASGGYQYAFEDVDAITGFTYWYYVSAYKDGSFTGPHGAITSHIESANINRNGRNSPNAPNGTIGLDTQWSGTYPFALTNAAYPRQATEPQRYKNIGAPFTVVPPVTPNAQVADLITVTPNPYKITGLNDVRSDPASHSINFLNVPADFTITILDVAGQVVFQRTVEGGINGRFTWDLFSKDGVEVSSGLYIYHLQYGDEAATGHFAILR
jgi:hypothetical protein